MRLGSSAENLRLDHEIWRQGREELTEEQQHLLSLQVDDVEDLFVDDGEGGSTPMFVFGLHSPFDGVKRHFPGT